MLSSEETPDLGETPSLLKILLSSGSPPGPAFCVTFAVLAMILAPTQHDPDSGRRGREIVEIVLAMTATSTTRSTTAM